jgi:hypothetical protein
MLTTRATERGVPVTEIRYDEALEALAEAFGERLGWTHPRGEASVSPASVEEARLLAEIAARYSVPLVPLGAGTGNGPNLREERIAGTLRAVVGEHRGRFLDAADAYKVWGERFFPVTASAASVPEVVREVLPLPELRDALTRVEGKGTAAMQDSVSHSGEAHLLTFEEGRI